jgi:hypothetical protein
MMRLANLRRDPSEGCNKAIYWLNRKPVKNPLTHLLSKNLPKVFLPVDSANSTIYPLGIVTKLANQPLPPLVFLELLDLLLQFLKALGGTEAFVEVLVTSDVLNQGDIRRGQW